MIKVKDNFVLGIVVGIAVPSLLYLFFLVSMDASGRLISDRASENMQLFSIAVNAWVMRMCLVSWNKDRIGRGILFVTLLFTLWHFAYYYTDLIR